MSESYHVEFEDKEDAQLFPLLDADDIKTELADRGSMLSRFLDEARGFAVAGYKALGLIAYEDRDTWEKARADIRAYETLRTFIGSTLQAGDITFAERDDAASAIQDDQDFEDDEAGRIPFADD